MQGIKIAAFPKSNSMSDSTLRITEVFLSLQGEAATAGYPTVFIRLTGCPLRCYYCDSEYAFHGGEKYTIEALLAQTAEKNVKHVCVTGGEPLAQPSCLVLLTALCDKGYSVSLETSGAMDISDVDPRVSVVMDIKTPASGELDKNRWENLPLLKQKDQIKFVICNRSDFDWACLKLDEHSLNEQVSEVLFSPEFENVQPTELANWVIESGRPIRFQLQMHKILWGDKPGV